jgi:hypothetical protein
MQILNLLIPRHNIPYNFVVRGKRGFSHDYSISNKDMPVPAVARFKACLRPLACADHRSESHRRHGCLSVVCIVCCQVEVSATS